MQDQSVSLPAFLDSHGLEIFFRLTNPGWQTARSDQALCEIHQHLTLLFQRRLHDIYTFLAGDTPSVCFIREGLVPRTLLQTDEGPPRLNLVKERSKSQAKVFWVYVKIYNQTENGDVQCYSDKLILALRELRGLDQIHTKRCLTIADVVLDPRAPLSTYIRIGYTDVVKVPQ